MYFVYDSFADLIVMIICIVADYAYDESFNQSRDLFKIRERYLLQNLLNLTQGRIDLTLDDEIVLQYDINQYIPNSMAELQLLPKPLAVRGIHIGVSRENPDHEKIAAAFDKAIADMKKDGSYELNVSKHYIYIKKPAQ